MATPRPELLTTISGVAVRRGTGEKALFFTAGMTIDADGAPKAYHPAVEGRPSGSPPGLDDVRNAGSPGNWFGVVTDSHGKPVVQGPNDPAPGFFVSATALVHKGHPRVNDPRRYVDANKIPFVVLPPGAMHAGNARLGDIAIGFNTRNERVVHAIFADIGPKLHIGEGSIALARKLGIPHDPKVGGESERVVLYLVFAGSGNGSARTLADIDRIGADLLAKWGGIERLRKTRP